MQGNDTVKFDAINEEGERIYCVNVEFELMYQETQLSKAIELK